MTGEWQPIEGAVTHPPVIPGIVIQPRSSWPTVLGIIAIVFGAAATLQSIAGVLVPLIMPSMSVFRGATGGVDMFAAIEQWRPWLLLANSLSILIAVPLVFGGVMLNMRRPASRGVLLMWAVAKVLLVCLTSYIGFHVSQAQTAAMAQAGVVVPANMGGVMSVMNVAGVILGVLWGWALPVFMLFWLMRHKIRNEMASWV